jgi:hypothetical protein
VASITYAPFAYSKVQFPPLALPVGSTFSAEKSSWNKTTAGAEGLAVLLAGGADGLTARTFTVCRRVGLSLLAGFRALSTSAAGGRGARRPVDLLPFASCAAAVETPSVTRHASKSDEHLGPINI